MRTSSGTLLLRLCAALILIMHSVPGMLNNGVNDFGNLYLNAVGFAPFGLYIAWAIKLSHVAAAICLLLEKYLPWAVWVTIFILVTGIVMIHGKEGWFVVGGGRNGVEFNVLFICVLLTILYPQGAPWGGKKA